jgi:hypothetical protein
MLPTEHNDPINEKILAISEDQIEGFAAARRSMKLHDAQV